MFVSFKTLLRASRTNFNCKSHMNLCNRARWMRPMGKCDECVCLFGWGVESVLHWTCTLVVRAGARCSRFTSLTWPPLSSGGGGSALSSWQPSLVIGWPEIIRFLLGKRIEKTTKSSSGTRLKAFRSPFLQHTASAIPFFRCYSFVRNPNKCHCHSRENDNDWHWDNEI